MISALTKTCEGNILIFSVMSVFVMVAALFYFVILLEYIGSWIIKMAEKLKLKSRDDKAPKSV